MADSIDDFLKLYLGQLMSVGLPEDLYGKVYEKIFPELIYDAGDSFIFSESESGEEYALCAKEDIPKHSCIFLVDHAWTNDGGPVSKMQLEKFPQLVARMQTMFGLREFDDDLESADIKYLDSAVVVSEICSCSLEEAKLVLKEKKNSLIDAVMRIQHGEQPAQGAADEESPMCSFEEFKEAMQTCAPEMSEVGVSDDYLKKMYTNFRQQRGKGIGAAMTSKYNWTDNTDDGLVEVYVAIKPNIHKDKITSCLTLNHWVLEVEGMGTLVSGYLTEHVIPDESWWAIESAGVLSMYLKKGRSHGEIWNELIKGEVQLSSKEIEEAAWKNDLKNAGEVKDILDEMWIHNQTYRIGSSQGKSQAPVWYIMDEVGSAMRHSETPNFACAPFFILGKGMALSIIWPIKDVYTGENITRNFIRSQFQGEEKNNFESRVAVLTSHLKDTSLKSVYEQKKETSDQLLLIQPIITPVPMNQPINETKSFFCDFINKEDLSRITSKFGCSVTTDMKEADYVLSKNPHLESDVSAMAKVNHFVGEKFLFKKSELFSMLEHVTSNSSWYRNIFDLQKEFSKLLNEIAGKCYYNFWVLRCNDSSENDSHPVVTSDVLRMSRLIESGFGIASRLVLNGPTYEGRKFALSYTILVTSTKPLELFVHNIPYIRKATQKYNPLKILDEYDSSGVLTERPSQAFDAKRCQDFADLTASLEAMMEKGGMIRTWQDIEQDIFKATGSIIGALASSKISLKERRSFGLLGVEFILDAEFCPVFLSFDRVPIFSGINMLEDVIHSVLCTDTSKGLPAGKSFTKISVS